MRSTRRRGATSVKMEEDEHARKKVHEEERGEVVCEKMNVEGDETMEETREKRKRGEVEDDDVIKRAKSSLSGQVSAEETMKILRNMERDGREREMTEERKTWTMLKWRWVGKKSWNS